MSKIKKAVIFSLCMFFSVAGLKAQRDIREVEFEEFLQHVLAHNLELIIEQYEVSAAEAALVASRVFEDPELEMIFPPFEDDEFSGFPRNIEFELEVPVELFGKRRNRIRQARAEKYASEARLDDFLRLLRAEAATTFIEVLASQRIIDRMDLTLEQLNQLMEINQALFEAGEIGEVDLMQTRLEARNFEAELFDELAGFSELMGEVYFLMGGITSDSLVFAGELELQQPVVDYQALREQTLENRSDIRAARRDVEASEYAMRLARSERLPDISLIAGYHNEGAMRPSPGFRAVYAGLVIPLKFSGFNRGEFQLSRVEFEQSQTGLEAVLLDAEAGLRSAWEKFLLQNRNRMLFTETILEDAERVRDAIVYSYQRGDVSLLEVLEAQRTLNEVYMNYYETLSQHAGSIIELSKVSGQWFVEF